MIQREFHERAIIAFMERRGHFYESEVTALKMMADAGWTRERAAQVLLEAIKTGVNPVARVQNLIRIDQRRAQGSTQPAWVFGRTEPDLLINEPDVLAALREYMRDYPF